MLRGNELEDTATCGPKHIPSPDSADCHEVADHHRQFIALHPWYQEFREEQFRYLVDALATIGEE